MKSWMSYVAVTSVVATALFMSACGKSSSSNGDAPVGGGGIVTPTLAPGTTIGFYAQTKNFASPLANLGSNYQIEAGFRDLLKYQMGVCDREKYSGGLANCDAWMSGAHDLVFQIDGSKPNEVRVVLRSYPSTYNCGYGCNWYYSLPSLTQFFGSMVGVPMGNPSVIANPMVLNMTIHPVNDSKGFEMRSYGPYGSRGYNLLLQIIVPQGKIEDVNLPFVTYMNGKKAGSGNFVRCQTQNCGM